MTRKRKSSRSQKQQPRPLTHTLFTNESEPSPVIELAQAWRDGYAAGHMDATDHLGHGDESRNPYGRGM